MAYRLGLAEENTVIIMEVLGALFFIAMLALLVAHFFGHTFGCFGNSNCMEAKKELNRFVTDVNNACQRSTLGSMDQPAKLGTYDFGSASTLALQLPNKFRVAKLKNPIDFVSGILGYPVKLVGDAISGNILKLYEDGTFSTKLTDNTRVWTVEATADECDKAHLCVLFSSTDSCQDGVRGDVEDFLNGGHIPFYLGTSSKGTVEYMTTGTKQINLKWLTTIDKVVRDTKKDSCFASMYGYCRLQPTGADWGTQYPDCTTYKDQIDKTNDTKCDSGISSIPSPDAAPDCASLSNFACASACPTYSAGSTYDKTCGTGETCCAGAG